MNHVYPAIVSPQMSNPPPPYFKAAFCDRTFPNRAQRSAATFFGAPPRRKPTDARSCKVRLHCASASSSSHSSTVPIPDPAKVERDFDSGKKSTDVPNHNGNHPRLEQSSIEANPHPTPSSISATSACPETDISGKRTAPLRSSPHPAMPCPQVGHSRSLLLQRRGHADETAVWITDCMQMANGNNHTACRQYFCPRETHKPMRPPD